MSVSNALHMAIYNKLAAGTALTALLSGGTASLYHQSAPDGAALDYVVWNVQGGGDENWTANRTKNLIVFVRGYSDSSGATAGTIDAQIDPLLHDQELSVSGWANFWMAREQDLEVVQVAPDKTKTWMAGGMYRVRLDKD